MKVLVDCHIKDKSLKKGEEEEEEKCTLSVYVKECGFRFFCFVFCFKRGKQSDGNKLEEAAGHFSRTGGKK